MAKKQIRDDDAVKDWTIRGFPARLKKRFMGTCMAEGIEWKLELQSIMETRLDEFDADKQVGR